MAQNANDKIANFLTRHDINLMRVDASIRKDVLKLLRGLYANLSRHIKNVDMTGPVRAIHRENRFNVLMRVTGENVDEVYGQITRLMDTTLGELAIIEQQNFIQTFNDAIRVDLLSPTLSVPVLKQLAKDTLIQGNNSRDWWRELDRRFKGSFRQQMAEGLLLSEPIPNLVKRIGTIRGVADRHARTIIRSSAQAILQNARAQTYKEHSNVIKGQQWLSTLDSRTCFVAGTAVLTETGYKDIEAIKKGDLIYNKDNELIEVIDTDLKKVKQLIEIELENGRIIKCTPEHLFLTKNDGWVEAQDLEEWHELIEMQ